MKAEEYHKHDALGLADLIRRGEVCASEVCEAAITRIELLNPALNAVIARRFDQARAESRKIAPGQAQPFAGVPFLLKGLVQCHPDLPSAEGSRFLAQHWPVVTSELASRMEAAGVIVLGKTNAPEFGLLATTEPELFGPSRNPWDLERTTGGSSGGSAAAVAAGMVPMAHGGDGGGSIRIPASCCGVFGLKPSRGRNPPGPPPYHGFCSLLMVEHVLSRSVRDSAAMLDVTSGVQPATLFELPAVGAFSFLSILDRPYERLRCAILEAPLFNQVVDPACRNGVQEAARLLAGLGHVVEPVIHLPIDTQALGDAFLVLFLTECAHVIEAFAEKLRRRLRTHELEPLTWVLNVIGREISAAELATALAHVQDAQWAMARFHEAHDILVSPVVAAPPLPLGSEGLSIVERALIRIFHRVLSPPATRMIRRRIRREAFAWTGYTQLANLTGSPAISVPLHWTPDGLPVGIQMSASIGSDALLLRLAAELEEAAPWSHRRPPTSITATHEPSTRGSHSPPSKLASSIRNPARARATASGLRSVE
jgi:amidase